MSGDIRENRLRRMAERQGLRLVKSRRRDPRALDYGGYALLKGNVVVFGLTREIALNNPDAAGPVSDLDDIEAYLTR